MGRGIIRVSALCVALCGCTITNDRADPATSVSMPIHRAHSTPLDMTVGDDTFAGAISLPLDEERTVVNLGAGRGPIPVCLVEGEYKTCLTLRPDEPADLAIDYEGDVRTLVLSYLGPQASFSPTYQTEHRGQLDIEIPMAYELVNVAIALTPYAKENPGLVATSEYLNAVRTQFAPYIDHPFVRALDQAMRNEGQYHTLKMNGAAFDMREGGVVTRSSVYKSTGFGANALAPLTIEMQDFAHITDFPRFYDTHNKLYSSQIDYLRDDVDIQGMLNWLKQEFPNVAEYDHIRILFSPLVGDNQSLKTFDEDGFRQMMAHVNFPYPGKEDAELSAEGLAFYRGLILFTELNHGYINPTIDPYSGAIQAAMPDMSAWASAEMARSYGSSTAIFTEMVNWALVSVRAYDVLPEKDAILIAKKVERIMVRNRGFKYFAMFQKKFLELYRTRENRTVGEILPALTDSLSVMSKH